MRETENVQYLISIDQMLHVLSSVAFFIVTMLKTSEAFEFSL